MTCLSACDKCLNKSAATAEIEKMSAFTGPAHVCHAVVGSRGDLYMVGKLLGHTNIRSTQVYADVVMETKVEAVNRLSSFFREQ